MTADGESKAVASGANEVLCSPIRAAWPVSNAGSLRAGSVRSDVVAVALSGGADSAMLAVALDRVARERGVPLILFHVHHGLLAEADGWALHVQALARLLGRPVEILHAKVGDLAGRGMEAAARDARYSALLDAAATHGVGTIWLAHHRDDQAETVLLRLLRGAGVAGLAAMRTTFERGEVTFVRPWLDLSRADILAAATEYSRETGWQPVIDPSNLDPRYTRAAVRTALMPALNARWPGWQETLVRHARQAEEAQAILDEVAAQDLAALIAAAASNADVPPSASASLRRGAVSVALIGDAARARSAGTVGRAMGGAIGPRLGLAAWRELSPARQRNVLRHWLGVLGEQMPSAARLADLQRQLTQLHSLGHDRSLTVNHGRLRIRCVRGVVFAEMRPPAR